MKNPSGKQLLEKLRKGTISSDEHQLLENWYADHMSKAAPFGNAQDFLSDMQILDAAFPFETEKQVRQKSIRLWPRIVAATAAIALIVFGIYFFNSNKKTVQDLQWVAQDIAPGKVGATLTLANGRKIKLSEASTGEIAREAGISVSKTPDGQLVYEIKETTGDPNKINTLTTAKGETYILTLPDKSTVWMNAASSLTYAAGLDERGLRKVKLEGEAYFEVAKDPSHPFIVETKGQEIEVLGTHFNVNAYTDEANIKTTLLEGSVKVKAGGVQERIKPGEQAINDSGKIDVVKVNPQDVTDWKDNDFAFNGEDFKSAMRKIARWYNIEIVYDQAVDTDIELGGWISRKNNLSAVLKWIQSTNNVHFKVEGRRITVTK